MEFIKGISLTKKWAFTGLFLWLTAACTGDFDELNTNPNSPTAVGAQYLLPSGLESAVDRYWGHRTRFERINIDAATLYIQHLARNIYSNEGDDYTVSQALLANNWKGFYNDAQANFQRIIALSNPEGLYPNTNYEGVALVMRSWVFMLLTDLYGAIPYSEALKGTAEEPNYKPKYDSQEQVYAGLLNDLKVANEKLVVGGPAIAGDIFYNGNILRWKKFANSLRLRLANRQAAKKPVESRAIFAEILGNAQTFPIFTSNADNAQLNCTSVLPSNNEWNQIIIQGGRGDWNLSKSLVDKMNSLGDSRITVFGVPNASGAYEGLPNGLPDAVANSAAGPTAQIGTYFTRADSPEVVMTYSELNLILAEAVLDGDATGDAEDYFKKGITASFEQFGLSVPAGFFEAVGAVTREKVLEQKWIGFFGQGVDAWTEWRRTGFPVFPPADSRAVFQNDGVVPTRFPYPNSEYSLNKENVEAADQLNGGVNDMKTKLWWSE